MASLRDLTQKMRLTTDATGATAGFKKAGTAIQGWVKGLAGAALASAALSKAVGFLSARVEASLDDYVRQERVLIRLRGRFGDATAAVVAQSEALAKLSGVSSTVINESQALLGAMGASSDQVDEFALAALNLSAAFNIELTEATRQLGATLSGLQGELSERVSALRDLTEEQRKAGEAATVINEIFGDAAVEGLSDYERALNRIAEAHAVASVAEGEAAVASKAFVEAQEEAVVIAELTAVATSGGSAATNLWALGVQKLENAWRGAGLVLELFINGPLGFYTDAVKTILAEQERLNAAMTDNASIARSMDEIYADAADSLKDTEKLFKDLGVTLESETNKQLEENEARLIALDDAYRAQEITLQDYRNGVDAVNESNRELTGTVEEQNIALDDGTLVLERYGDEWIAARQKVEGATAALQENEVAVRSNSAAASLGRGAQNRLGISGGTFQFIQGADARAAFLEDAAARNPGFLAAGPAQNSDVKVSGHLSP